VLDEHLLHETVGFPVVEIMMSLTDFTDLRELCIAEYTASVAESLEGVFGLARHHDVPDESQEIALPCGVGEVTRFPEYCAQRFLAGAGFVTEYLLIVLEQALVLSHVGNVTTAEVAKANVFGLLLVILESLEKGLVLHYGVVHLALQKVYSAVHDALLIRLNYDANFRVDLIVLLAQARPLGWDFPPRRL
jgi:hypothetical protein